MGVRVQVESHIATITLDRPEAGNAIDQATAHALSVSLGNADADDTVRVIIISGAGGTFSTGMDLAAFSRGELFHSPTNGFAGVTRRVLKKPLIAAVEGQALAGGFEIALACDLIVAAEDARFGLTQMQIGLLPDAGGLIRLQRQLPAKIAAELVLTGETVSSALLASLGLLNRVVPRGEALPVARQLAAHIVANDALAVEVAKRVVRESEDWSATEMFDRQNEITAPLFDAARARRFSVS